jgi:HEAT repeat protein
MEIKWWMAALVGIILALTPAIFLVGKLRPRSKKADQETLLLIKLGKLLSRGYGGLSYRQVRALEKTDPQIIARVLQMYFYEWPRERQAAVVNLLVRIGFVDLFLKQINSPKCQERVQAAEMLGIFQSPSGVPSLLERLGDPEEEVRWAVSAALRRIQEPTTIEPLITALADLDGITPARVAEVLVAMGPQVVPVLLDYLPQVGELVQGNIYEILGQIGDKQAVEALLRGVKAESVTVRSKAVQALGELRDVEVGPVLVEVLQDPEPEVRARAAQALGNLEWWGGLSALNEARKDDDWLVKASANQAIAELTKKGKNRTVE